MRLSGDEFANRLADRWDEFLQRYAQLLKDHALGISVRFQPEFRRGPEGLQLHLGEDFGSWMAQWNTDLADLVIRAAIDTVYGTAPELPAQSTPGPR